MEKEDKVTLASSEWAAIRELIDDLTDEDPCWLDHHGYCQAHYWMATEPRCPHARAKELLATDQNDVGRAAV